MARPLMRGTGLRRTQAGELLPTLMGAVGVRDAREPQAEQVTQHELAVVFAVRSASVVGVRQGVRHQDPARPYDEQRRERKHFRATGNMRTNRYRFARQPPDPTVE